MKHFDLRQVLDLLKDRRLTKIKKYSQSYKCNSTLRNFEFRNFVEFPVLLAHKLSPFNGALAAFAEQMEFKKNDYIELELPKYRKNN